MSRIKVDRITNRAGTGDPLFPNGISVVGLTSLSNVIAGVATFSNVTIGGTITYDDVTNIDSVGIVTARSGLKVSAGGANIVGVVTASTGIDAASNLILRTGGSEKVRVTSAGKVGINSISPNEHLDVVGNVDIKGGSNQLRITTASPAVKFTDSDAPTGFGMVGVNNTSGSLVLRSDDGNALSSSFMGFEVDGNERLRIGSAGQIGIAGANYGTSGQVMTSGGASAAPSWNTPAAGAWALLQSASNPNTSTVDFVGLTTTYAAYKVVFMGANINSTNQREMRCRIYLGGALQTGSSDYRQQTMYMTYTSSSYNGSGGTMDCIALSGRSGTNQNSKGYNGELTFPMKLRTSGGAESLQAYYGTVVSQSYTNFVSGFMENSFSTLLTGIQFDSPDPYNITDGQFYLYGLTRT